MFCIMSYSQTPEKKNREKIERTYFFFNVASNHLPMLVKLLVVTNKLNILILVNCIS